MIRKSRNLKSDVLLIVIMLYVSRIETIKYIRSSKKIKILKHTIQVPRSGPKQRIKILNLTVAK